MSHTFVNHSTKISTIESILEPKFKVMDLPPLESTTRALSIFCENTDEWQEEKHYHRRQLHQHLHLHLHLHHQHHHHHKRQKQRERNCTQSSPTSFKSKPLPTRTIPRGLFKGYNDMRRFNCISQACSLNSDAFRSCQYCRHIPYVPSPLKDVACNSNKHSTTNYASDKEYKTWSSSNSNNNTNNINNIQYRESDESDDEGYDAFNEYLSLWKQQQNINKIRVPQEVLFIAPRGKSKQQFPSHSLKTVSSNPRTTIANERCISHEQHPSKIFNTICKAKDSNNNNNNDKVETTHKGYGMLGLLKSSDLQIKQRFNDIKNLGKGTPRKQN